MTGAILALRQTVILGLMAAMLTTSPNQQQFLRPSANVKNWQKEETVKKAEKKLNSSAVKISLSKKVKYKLNGAVVKTKEVFGLMKNEDIKMYWESIVDVDEIDYKVETYEDIINMTKEENQKINIYDSKGSEVAVINTKDLNKIEIYNDDWKMAEVEFSNSKCEISYSEYEFDDEGKLIHETMWWIVYEDTRKYGDETAYKTLCE